MQINLFGENLKYGPRFASSQKSCPAQRQYKHGPRWHVFENKQADQHIAPVETLFRPGVGTSTGGVGGFLCLLANQQVLGEGDVSTLHYQYYWYEYHFSPGVAFQRVYARAPEVSGALSRYVGAATIWRRILFRAELRPATQKHTLIMQ